MYIRDYAGFGDPQPTPPNAPLLKKSPPFLVFRRIGPFAVDKATVTPQLKQQVARVVDVVRARLNTAQPIGVIRLVGHTDDNGSPAYNVDLGNRRAGAVRDELHVQLRDVLHRVLVEVEPSPGKAQPIGANTTATGRAANRRVDVYVAPPIPPARPWPKGKVIDWTVRDPDRGGVWDQYRFKRGMPDPLGGKTVRQFLMDLCPDRWTKQRCKTAVDGALSLGCKGLEALFTEFGGVLSEDQKEEVKRRCKEGADKSL